MRILICFLTAKSTREYAIDLFPSWPFIRFENTADEWQSVAQEFEE